MRTLGRALSCFSDFVTLQPVFGESCADSPAVYTRLMIARRSGTNSDTLIKIAFGRVWRRSKWNEDSDSSARVFRSRGTGDADLSAAPRDELFGNPKADTGAENALGGEKRFEHARQVVLLDPYAGIANHDFNAVMRRAEHISRRDAKDASLLHGVDCIGDDVGEDLQHLSPADVDFLQVVEAGIDRNLRREHLGVVDRQHVLNQFMEMDVDRRACVLVVPKCLARDVRDALQFLFRGDEELVDTAFRGGLLAGEEDDVDQ